MIATILLAYYAGAPTCETKRVSKMNPREVGKVRRYDSRRPTPDCGLKERHGADVAAHVKWSVEPRRTPGGRIVVRMNATSEPLAYSPGTDLPVLIPKPKVQQLDFDRTLSLTGRYKYPAGSFMGMPEFKRALSRRFLLPPPAAGAKAVNVDGGLHDLGSNPNAYQIKIDADGFSVLAKDDDGLHYAVERLAQLAFVKDGKLVLPTGTIDDYPTVQWRGVHLFVGPDAVDFQKKLWERVLLPLGFNKVVLQCERTDWTCLPGIKTPLTMPREKLKELFGWYRSIDVEPIPLIQSFGHEEWLFANGQNSDVAVNPAAPYALDPRKPRTKELLGKLWDEVATLLAPQTVHFGCDEINMVGGPDDPKVVTDLWALQLPVLGEIAAKHSWKAMIWGDMALAPGEAPDATNAPDVASATARRAAIPPGMQVADWHYKADPNPKAFYPTLQLWEREDHPPIATAWRSPENVRGMDLAAVYEHMGSLQTTWSGYESSEKNMLSAMDQFSALVLAADYSWSARQDDVDKLGYSPEEAFRRLYFAKPTALTVKTGTTFAVGPTTALRVDGVLYRLGSPIQAGGEVLADKVPRVAMFELGASGSEVALALNCTERGRDGAEVAEATIHLASGKTVVRKIVYGVDVRASEDRRTCVRSDRCSRYFGLRISLGETATVTSVDLKPLTPAGGLRVFGVTIF